MSGGEDSGSDARVADLIERYLAEKRSGRAIGREAFAAMHPELEVPLGEALRAMELLGAVPARAGERGAPAPAPLALGDFRIVREIGRGGMGVVFEAEQISLSRRVALKVLPHASLLPARELDRFRREARTAAQLLHPNIVPVHAVGCEHGTHFYAMQYVDGESLADAIRRLRGGGGAPEGDAAPRTPLRAPGDAPAGEHFRTVARLGREAADALRHAHAQGVIHRDVKPANCLVDRAGRLWLTDFGLARLGSDPGLTAPGALLGTLRYMSPEQAARKAVDARTDLYSLGATLYELATLAPAFPGDDPERVLADVLAREPEPPSRRRPGIPAGLERVILKALAKEPALRYATAQELADDLDRFLAGRPVRARPPGLPSRLRGAVRRRPLLAASAAVAVAAAAALAIVASGAGRDRARADAAIETASGAREQAKEALRRARVHELVAASEEAVRTDPVLGLLLAREAVRQSKEAASLRALRGALAVSHERARFTGHRDAVFFAALTPDGTRAITASQDASLRIFDGSGALLRSVRCFPRWAAVSPRDGRCLLRGEAPDGGLRIVDADGGSRPLPGGPADAVAGAWSADGRRIVTGSSDGEVLLRDEAGAPLRRLATLSGAASLLAFSPDGGTLAAAAAGRGDVHLLAADGSRQSSFAAGDAGVIALAFPPGGDELLVGLADGTVRVFGVDGRPIAVYAVGGAPARIEPSPDGAAVGVLTRDGVALLLDRRLGRLERLQGHSDRVHAIAFSPDGARFVTASRDRTACLWAGDGRMVAVLRGHEDAVLDARFSPDGSKVLTASADGTARLFDVEPPEPVALPGPPVRSVVADPARGRILLVADGDAALRACDGLGRPVPSPESGVAGATAAAVAEDGSTAVGTADGRVLLFRDGEAGGGFRAANGAIAWLAFRDGGRRVAVRGADLSAGLFEPDGRELARALPPAQAVVACAPSGDSLLLVATSDGWFRLLGPDGLVRQTGPRAARPFDLLRASPRADFVLASASRGREPPDTRLLRADGTVAEELAGHALALVDADFSGDGEWIVTASLDRTARILRRDGAFHALLAHGHAVRSARFSGDSARLVTASADGVARVFTLDGTEVDTLPSQGGDLAGAAMAPGDRGILTWARGGRVLLWLAGADDLVRRAESRLVREFTPAERARYRDLLDGASDALVEAHERVEALFLERILVADVLDALRSDVSIDPGVREAALELAARRRDDPERWNVDAWAIVRIPGLDAAEYRRALRLASAAHRAVPGDLHVRNTLGIGQYRAGLLVEAVGNLLACDTAHRASAEGPVLEDVAGLGLCYAALGRLGEARAELARVHGLAETPRYAGDSPRRAWIEELEAAIARAEGRTPR